MKGTVEAGSPADLTIFDPRMWNESLIRQTFLSKGKNTPFGGKKVTGKVMCNHRGRRNRVSGEIDRDLPPNNKLYIISEQRRNEV